MPPDQLDAALAPLGLIEMGHVPFQAPARTLFLVGAGPGFWPVFTASPEYLDDYPDPLDRWSGRVLGDLAAALGAEVVFPFGGPPYEPFLKWALDSGRCHQSPVGMLVHDVAGMMISFRCGLILPGLANPPDPAPSPCTGCARPCVSACPVGALRTDAPYDVAACKAHIASPAGSDCRENGCLVRRACPVSQSFGRDTAQSGFHMTAFLKG
ncbi:ferredoxin [Lutimaribacter sp. EGI FJ00015]|uniref:Ferredoxin n=1 Tax=Lutimaribacter degradans TaxID=2945989 RepID=A0ACC5ZY09_9RHOB|nr:ferredoxin [Lutimaribacter sp. EGI FJ00013]MCM2563224.1 ferredoxin [Lutimaribacter sp. EGI FJ00013]MCO0614453.1 ferredoxin [Lutimaribacter sp. EGI FJ00015]MCO0635946.1 ferredoxin [Lutimaribacter sp. EGI FJ00014]